MNNNVEQTNDIREQTESDETTGKLPVELIMEIIKHCDTAKDFASFSLVNSTFNACCKSLKPKLLERFTKEIKRRWRHGGMDFEQVAKVLPNGVKHGLCATFICRHRVSYDDAECFYIRSHYNEGVKEGMETHWEVNEFQYQLGYMRARELQSTWRNQRNTLAGVITAFDEKEMEAMELYAEEVRYILQIGFPLGKFGVLLRWIFWLGGALISQFIYSEEHILADYFTYQKDIEF